MRSIGFHTQGKAMPAFRPAMASVKASSWTVCGMKARVVVADANPSHVPFVDIRPSLQGHVPAP